MDDSSVPAEEPMSTEDALEILYNGYAFLTRKGAEQVCTCLGVPFAEHLLVSWQTREEALAQHGFFPEQDGPGSGVGILELGYHICEHLGIDAPGKAFHGKGKQARVNAMVITEHVLLHGTQTQEKEEHES